MCHLAQHLLLISLIGENGFDVVLATVPNLSRTSVLDVSTLSATMVTLSTVPETKGPC